MTLTRKEITKDQLKFSILELSKFKSGNPNVFIQNTYEFPCDENGNTITTEDIINEVLEVYEQNLEKSLVESILILSYAYLSTKPSKNIFTRPQLFNIHLTKELFRDVLNAYLVEEDRI